MKGSASHLLEFLESSRKRLIIPVYQRNYDWKTENCKQLFDDLVQVIRENKPIRTMKMSLPLSLHR